MEKFPSDVEIAERLTRKTVDSDLLIINDRPDSIVKAILGPTLTRRSNNYYDNEYNNSCTNDYNNKRRSGVGPKYLICSDTSVVLSDSL